MFKRAIQTFPHPDRPNGPSVEVRYILSGPHGAVQFVYWRYAGVDAEQMREIDGNYPSVPPRRREDGDGGYLYPVDLGYHSPKPLYPDATPIRERSQGIRPNPDFKDGDPEWMRNLLPEFNGPPVACEYTGSPICYYDGSGLNAEEPLALLVDRGPEAVWSFLVDYYERTFA